MLRPGLACVLFLTLAVAPGCDDDDAPAGSADAASADAPTDAPPPDASGPDAPPPDAAVPDAQPSMGVGLACADDLSCGTGKICLDEEESFPAAGYCTKTCTNDLDCGGDAFCSPDLDGFQICLLKC